MAIKSETKTLRLTFVDGINKNVSYSIASPKADLDKATVDAAANAIVDSKIFATDDGGNLMALKDSQIVTRKVETLE
ncbi:DUF2922 domain-containing protein [Megasphaera sp.]|uniref:DUF2922 domain-containing protein n=1 Tax=Megasphaera TaxID=906 RepID=UPI001E0597FB|nr:DUF2922 domain-containing protein [Megasphaera sp.]MBS6790241.1 DUF2922 domain-containing protein [Megasphaera sp.]